MTNTLTAEQIAQLLEAAEKTMGGGAGHYLQIHDLFAENAKNSPLTNEPVGMKMLVDNEWLKDKISSDPDCEVEAWSGGNEPVGVTVDRDALQFAIDFINRNQTQREDAIFLARLYAAIGDTSTDEEAEMDSEAIRFFNGAQ